LYTAKPAEPVLVPVVIVCNLILAPVCQTTATSGARLGSLAGGFPGGPAATAAAYWSGKGTRLSREDECSVRITWSPAWMLPPERWRS